MSMPASSVNQTKGPCLINKLPDDTMGHIFSFLGDQDILDTTGRVCKSWRSNEERVKVLVPEVSQRLHHRIEMNRVHAQLIERKYPERLRQVFRNSHKPISKLPVLELPRTGRAYIDFLKPEDLSHPIMRFKDDIGRPGIAFSLKSRTNPGLERVQQIADPEKRARLQAYYDAEWPTGVFAIFKRYTNPDSHWTSGSKESLIGFGDDSQGDPGVVDPAFIQALLSDQNPAYRII